MNPLALIHQLVEQNALFAWPVLAVGFFILAKSADIFVDSSVVLADKLKVPKLVIGIVLVSLATTAPELSVSLMSALRGSPEMALGNAIGSVICDDGLALGFAGLLTTAPILISPIILRMSGLFLIFIQVLAFVFVVFDHTLSRGEGVVLVTLFVGYIVQLYRMHRKGVLNDGIEAAVEEAEKAAKEGSMLKIIGLFVLSLAGIIIASDVIVPSAQSIARAANIPEAVISLTLIALGTSIPEVATCIAAARKSEGAIAVGNIIGADIMNICWVAGASAIANDLVLGRKGIIFMFPSMFIMVGAMLIMLRIGYRLTRAKGAVLLGLYVLYIASFFVFFGPTSG